MLNYINTSASINNKIKNVILNFDASQLTWFDFSYIVTHIAIFTVESVFWVFRDRCTKCGEVIQIKTSKDKFVLFEDLPDLKGYPVNAVIGGPSVTSLYEATRTLRGF